jgi:hypothetical protein
MSIKNWFIFNFNNITKFAILIFLGLAILYLLIASILIRDISYPRSHPLLFTTETILFSFVTGLIYFLMAYGRGVLGWISIFEYLLISIKFGVLHILLQFSGFYSYALSK